MDRPSHVGTRRARVGVAIVVAGLLGACAEPPLAGSPPTVGADEPTTAEAPDPVRDELVERVEALRTGVTDARGALVRAADASGPGAAEAAAQDALAHLLHDPAGDGTVGLFPATSSERERDDQDDLLTAVSSLAREAGGSLGRAVVEVLRDPVAGDLGAWERDAAGMLERARAAVDGVADVDEGVADVRALPGDGTRALAWLLLAAEGADPELVRAAAARADAHLAVVEVALELALSAPAAA